MNVLSKIPALDVQELGSDLDQLCPWVARMQHYSDEAPPQVGDYMCYYCAKEVHSTTREHDDSFYYKAIIDSVQEYLPAGVEQRYELHWAPVNLSDGIICFEPKYLYMSRVKNRPGDYILVDIWEGDIRIHSISHLTYGLVRRIYEAYITLDVSVRDILAMAKL